MTRLKRKKQVSSPIALMRSLAMCSALRSDSASQPVVAQDCLHHEAAWTPRPVHRFLTSTDVQMSAEALQSEAQGYVSSSAEGRLEPLSP